MLHRTVMPMSGTSAPLADAIPDAPVGDLLALVQQARDHSRTDPFGSPVLAVALAIIRRMDAGTLSLDQLDAVVRRLRDDAFDARAARLQAYLGGLDGSHAAMQAVASRLVRPDPADSPVPFRVFRDTVERTRFAAVFTAHPTFSLPREQAAALAEAACGRPGPRFASHRPSKPTLAEEFDQAVAAISHGRDAIDQLTGALLAAAAAVWPDRWRSLAPRPVILASWVGYDTDGRTDIGWWDTLRLRLVMKRLQLARVRGKLDAGPAATRLDEALAAVDGQIAACPHAPEPDAVASFAAVLIGNREAAMVTADPVLRLLDAAIAASPDPMTLAVARAGLASHGLALAHTHVRLNASQLHNAARVRLGLAEPPADASRRRVLLAAMGEALDRVQPEPVDFGALMAEQASAVRLMMTVVQITKHVDSATPIRFLIAETESGYTLLTALWLARLFGIERQIEISPLFETAEAMEQGARVVAEALRSPHWCAYLRATGRMCLQFGYSDSGRYVGQLAASYLIERLRLKVAELLVKHGLTDVEVVLFDTGGESIGRGAHPGSFADRLKYYSPTATRHAFAAAGIRTREECAIQGGDGYLLFGTPELAAATIARTAEHAFAAIPSGQDPIYAEPDFAADFFATIGGGDARVGGRSGLCRAVGRVRPGAARPNWLPPLGAAVRQWWPGGDPPPARAAGDPQQRHPATARLVCEHAAGPRRRGGPAQGGFLSPATDQPALPPGARFRRPCLGAFRYGRAARGRRPGGPRRLAGPGAPRHHARPRRRVDERGPCAGSPGVVAAGDGDGAPDPARPSGARRRVARCPSHGNFRGAAARATDCRHPAHLAPGHRNPRILAPTRRDPSGPGGPAAAAGRSRLS